LKNKLYSKSQKVQKKAFWGFWGFWGFRESDNQALTKIKKYMELYFLIKKLKPDLYYQYLEVLAKLHSRGYTMSYELQFFLAKIFSHFNFL